MFRALWVWELYRLLRLRNVLPMALGALLIGLSPVYFSESSGFWLGGLLGFLLGYLLVAQSASARDQERHFLFSRPLLLPYLVLVRMLGAAVFLVAMVGLVVPATSLGDIVIYSSSFLVWVHLMEPAVFSLDHSFGFIARSILASGLLGVSIGLLSFFWPFWRTLRRPWPWLPSLAFLAAAVLAGLVPALEGWQKALFTLPALAVLAVLNFLLCIWLSGLRLRPAAQGMP